LAEEDHILGEEPVPFLLLPPPIPHTDYLELNLSFVVRSYLPFELWYGLVQNM
jgi:hypothetical protein